MSMRDKPAPGRERSDCDSETASVTDSGVGQALRAPNSALAGFARESSDFSPGSVNARIMGIDAGFGGMGVVGIEGRRVIYAAVNRTEKTPTKRGVRVADDNAQRCQEQARFLLAAQTAMKPSGVVAELPTGAAKSAKANIAMGMAVGIVTTFVEATGLPAEWVTPQAGKKATTGRNAGTKEEVEAGALRLLDWSAVKVPKAKAAREHIFDAAAAYIAAEGGTLVRALAQRVEVFENA